MSTFDAFLIAVVQGLTEFLPISSSAHLKLLKMLLGKEVPVLFDLVCHLGTLMALLFFLREEIKALFIAERRKLLLLFVAMLPLIPCYFLLKPLREFASQPQFLGVCLIVTALILFGGQKWRIKRKNKDVTDALWIGALQSAALIPGISRSASTISCAHVLGWSPREAVRFSFLLAIPTIIGGNLLELVRSEIPASLSFSSCLIAFLSSWGVGALVIKTALSVLEKGKLKPFAWYCLILGIVYEAFRS